MINHFITWDWKSAPDIKEINNALNNIALHNSMPTVYGIETDSDSHAMLISNYDNLSNDLVQRLYQESESGEYAEDNGERELTDEDFIIINSLNQK